MERFKSVKIILFLAVVLIASAALAKSASVLLQEGLYAEEVDGDLDAAIRIYAQIIKDGSGQKSHIAQAMYRQGMCYMKKQQEQQAKLVFDELVAGAEELSQGNDLRRWQAQSLEPMAVGSEAIGQDEGVTSVVLGAA